jgi:hypothetical protein
MNRIGKSGRDTEDNCVGPVSKKTAGLILMRPTRHLTVQLSSNVRKHFTLPDILNLHQ